MHFPQARFHTNEHVQHKKAQKEPDEQSKEVWLWWGTNMAFDCSNKQMALTGGSIAGEVHNLQSLLISKQINSSTPPR